jgi:nicotinamidase-related amidase
MDIYTQPDYKNIALLTIDTQNDFSLSGAIMEIKGTCEIIPNIKKIIQAFRKAQKPIIHIVRLYKEDGSNVDNVRRKRIEEGLQAIIPYSKGAELVDELRPNEEALDADLLLNGAVLELAPNEYVIYKSRWGAFYNTSLEKFLRDKKISTLVFTGCNFPNCPRTSIYEASERDFKIVLIKDAISGIYEKGMEEMKNIGCEILDTDEFVEKIKI